MLVCYDLLLAFLIAFHFNDITFCNCCEQNDIEFKSSVYCAWFSQYFNIFAHVYRHCNLLVVKDVNLQNKLFPANDREWKIHTYKEVHKSCQLEKQRSEFFDKTNTSVKL